MHTPDVDGASFLTIVGYVWGRCLALQQLGRAREGDDPAALLRGTRVERLCEGRPLSIGMPASQAFIRGHLDEAVAGHYEIAPEIATGAIQLPPSTHRCSPPYTHYAAKPQRHGNVSPSSTPHPSKHAPDSCGGPNAHGCSPTWPREMLTAGWRHHSCSPTNTRWSASMRRRVCTMSCGSVAQTWW